MTELHYESLSGTVLPIFLADGDAGIGFCGSGVLLDKGVFLTCWHCVKEANETVRIVVAVPDNSNDRCRIVDLKDISRDASGLDLATGLVDAEPTVPLQLAEGPYVLMSHDVWAFGYPFTDQSPSNMGGFDFTLNGRILRGYATRTFM
jgi:Trypsin-like peptidase domain